MEANKIIAKIGDRYHAIRHSLGLPQDEMAAKLDRTQTAYSYLERHGHFLDIEITDKLITLGVSPIFLLQGIPPVLMPGVNPHRELPADKTFRPHIDLGPSPLDLLRILEDSQKTGEIELKDWQVAYKKLAESILPHLEKLERYMHQLVGKKFQFNLIQT